MAGDHDFDDAIDPDFDARARSAGRALRESAPVGGISRVRAAKRRRTVVQAGGAVAVAALAVGGIVVLTRSDDTLDVADAPTTEPVATVVTSSPLISTETAPTDATSPAPAATPGPATSDTTPATGPAATTPATEPDATQPAEPTVDYVSAGFYAGPEWVGDRTSAITEPLADGLYWSDEYSSDGTTVTFRLVQRIRGDACIEEFGDAADVECASDSGRITEPSATITVTADGVDTSVISNAGVGAGTGFEAFRVPAEEFIRLAAGGPPSPGAPEGYSWERWGVGVVVSGGRVVAAHQQFSS